MEAAAFLDASINFCQTIGREIPEGLIIFDDYKQ